MQKFSRVLAHVINTVLIVWLLLACVYFAALWTPNGWFAAVVSAVLAVLVTLKRRWGYFATAVWGLACYQLAKEGLMLMDVKRLAMISGIITVVAALYLHEYFCRRQRAAQ